MFVFASMWVDRWRGVQGWEEMQLAHWHGGGGTPPALVSTPAACDVARWDKRAAVSINGVWTVQSLQWHRIIVSSAVLLVAIVLHTERKFCKLTSRQPES